MSRREICSDCNRPKVTCLCHLIEAVEHHLMVSIIQIEDEAQSAKNTATLLPKMSGNIRLYNDKEIEEVKRLTSLKDTYLLYPTKDATKCNQIGKNNVQHIIVLDGTWRKAKRYYLTHEWLQQLPALTLSKTYKSNYQIRKTSVENGLSTLEAVAYGLNEIEGVDPSSFLNLMAGINKEFTKYMPNDVKARYEN